MKLHPIHTTKKCDSSSCPTIYLNEAGNYVFQGFKIKQEVKAQQGIPSNEDIIELPKEFIEAFLAKVE